MREFQAQAEDTAKDLGASIWYGLPNPESGAWVLWPGTDLASYVDFARRIDARVLYVDTSLEVICVARDGVLHFFETRAGAFEEEFHPAVTSYTGILCFDPAGRRIWKQAAEGFRPTRNLSPRQCQGRA